MCCKRPCDGDDGDDDPHLDVIECRGGRPCGHLSAEALVVVVVVVVMESAVVVTAASLVAGVIRNSCVSYRCPNDGVQGWDEI